MADAPENLKEAQKTESRTIEEPKIQTPDRRLYARKRGRTQDFDLGQSDSGRRSDWRHETESRSWADNRSDADIRVNLQRRSHETESRSLPHKKRALLLDWGGNERDLPGERDRPGGRSLAENRENEHSGLGINEAGKMQQSLRDVEKQHRRSHETESRFLQHKNMDTNRRFDDRIESDYPVRPGERDCMYYKKNGLCGYGRHCVLNHPRCKYFMRGGCKNGSTCQFIHPMNMDRRASEPNRRFYERIREPESSSRAEKRAKPNPDLRERLEAPEEGENLREQEKIVVKNPWILKLEKRYNKDITEIRDGIVAGYKRTRMEQRQRENIEWQRMEEQRLREEQREKDIEKQRREEWLNQRTKKFIEEIMKIVIENKLIALKFKMF